MAEENGAVPEKQGTAQNQAADGYEFTEEENLVFLKLVRNMRKAGKTVVAGGAIFGAYMVISWLGSSCGEAESASGVEGFLISLDYFLWIALATGVSMVGFLVLRAVPGFQMVVDTQGDDIAHLMGSLRNLCKAFGTILWVVVPCLALLLASLVFLMVMNWKA